MAQESKLSSFVMIIVDVLKPFCPCNVQLGLRKDTPYIFVFNAGCSGTIAMRALAGFNEPKMIL